MSNKSKRRPPGGAGGFRTTSGGTKAPKVSVKGSPLTKGKNSGGTQPAHVGEVQGSSHQGSSLGKRSSG